MTMMIVGCEMNMLPELLRRGDPLMPRADVLKLLQYKTIAGFERWRKKQSDFPAPAKRGTSFTSRVYYYRDEVAQWWKGRFSSEVPA